MDNVDKSLRTEDLQKPSRELRAALENHIVRKLRGLRRSLPGKLRNKPCDCGSGLKAKACNCDIYDRK